jgi:5-methylcytosine-specific restriction endonuclease McrA
MAQSWAKKFYNSNRWKSCRREVIKRDRYTCNDCYGRAGEVHHIIELTPDNIDDDRIALNPDNLVSLCGACHKKRTSGSDGDVVAGYIFNEAGQVVRR